MHNACDVVFVLVFSGLLWHSEINLWHPQIHFSCCVAFETARKNILGQNKFQSNCGGLARASNLYPGFYFFRASLTVDSNGILMCFS